METLHLIAHRAHPPVRVRAVTARVLSYDANWCVLRWKVEGAGDLMVPRFAGQGWQDGLWQATCFELFAMRALCPFPLSAHPEQGGGVEMVADAMAYSEFNFSPSERWAAYDFDGYRSGMMIRAMARGPVTTPRRGGDVLLCDVAIPAPSLPPLPWRYGLTAVLEEAGGVKSYWAVAHAREIPDFHHPACLGAWLAAPDGA